MQAKRDVYRITGRKTGTPRRLWCESFPTRKSGAYAMGLRTAIRSLAQERTEFLAGPTTQRSQNGDARSGRSNLFFVFTRTVKLDLRVNPRIRIKRPRGDLPANDYIFNGAVKLIDYSATGLPQPGKPYSQGSPRSLILPSWKEKVKIMNMNCRPPDPRAVN